MLDIGISYFLQISYKKVRNLSSHPDKASLIDFSEALFMKLVFWIYRRQICTPVCRKLN